jgi:hypothetical protein
MLADMIIIGAGAATSALANGFPQLFIVREEALQSIYFCSSVFLSEFGPSHDTRASNAGHRFRRHDVWHAAAYVRCSAIDLQSPHSTDVRRIDSVQPVNERRT